MRVFKNIRNCTIWPTCFLMKIFTALKGIHFYEDFILFQVQSVFKDYAKLLEKIAYILAPDLHRFMDKESQVC